MTVRIYRSTDSSAPVLTGQAGTLVALLDACLVNGYTGKPAAGWTKPYIGANKAVFKQPAGTSGFYLRVDDAIGTFLYAHCRGYEVMTDVDTGVNPFPTVAQMANGTFWTKSSTNDATARPWILLTNEKIFYLITNYNSSATYAASQGHCFGDMLSYKPGDLYSCIHIGGTSNAVTLFAGLVAYLGISTQAGCYLSRPTTGATTPLLFAKYTNTVIAPYQPAYMGKGNSSYCFSFPNLVDGGVYVGVVHIAEYQTVPKLRGELPGIYNPMHADALGFTHGDTWMGTGAFAGKQFEAVNTYSVGQFVMEISDTW